MSCFLALCASVYFPHKPSMPAQSLNCMCNGQKLYGKVKVVRNFADFKVKRVRSFPDLKVKRGKKFSGQVW